MPKRDAEIERIKQELVAERKRVAEAREGLGVLVTHLDVMRQERDDARAYGDRLYQEWSGNARQTACMWCGHVFDGGVPASQDERLHEHAKTCKKHPLRAAEAEIDRLKARINELEAEVGRERGINSGLIKLHERLKDEVVRLSTELTCIACADPSTWEADMRDQFQLWVQSRARDALTRGSVTTVFSMKQGRSERRTADCAVRDG